MTLITGLYVQPADARTRELNTLGTTIQVNPFMYALFVDVQLLVFLQLMALGREKYREASNPLSLECTVHPADGMQCLTREHRR